MWLEITKYNIAMADRNSKLSRREWFGRMIGRSRSAACAELAPDRHPAALVADELLRRGDPAQAALRYAQLLERAPDFLPAYRRLAWCHLRCGHTEAARTVLQRLLARQAEDATALLFLGLAHAMDGAIEPAVQAWRGVHDYSRILVQGELNLLLLLADGGGLPSAAELVERVEQVIREQNRLPGSQGVYF